jgi:hypothetical protein
MSLCAFAAIGALMAAVIAAMASILFRMMNSFGGDAGRFAPSGNPTQFIARLIVPGTVRLAPLQFSAFFAGRGNPLKPQASAIPEPRQRLDCRPRFDFPPDLPETSMTLTAAHVPAIVALIAGVLILLMPRLLNFIVAIYLIFVGLVGLGVLRMFHL